MGVNLNGAFHTVRAALPALLRERRGCIVNVASTAAMRGQAYCSHYAASKAALLNFTRSVALEFASRRLRANCVCPGPVRTPLIRNFIPRPDFEQQLINYYRPPVQGQSFAPEQAAEVIAFLASDEARMINGAALLADGGTLA
jgi:NAD(P)-dependent dehydrogenase (short-subunit alcohol dehydrogenase family)